MKAYNNHSISLFIKGHQLPQGSPELNFGFMINKVHNCM
jgi:hypothetical protein